MVKPSAESLELLEAAKKYYGMADSIWTCRQAELKETQRALDQAFEERHKALAFLHKVERRLEVVDITVVDDQEEQEEDDPPKNVASALSNKSLPQPFVSFAKTASSDVIAASTTTRQEQAVVAEERRFIFWDQKRSRKKKRKDCILLDGLFNAQRRRLGYE
jgi:hypothetical protein